MHAELQLDQLRHRPGLEGFLSPEDGCFAFFEESAEGLRSALKDLEGYVNAEGPFDAIMGFSEGASLAASFIASQKNWSEDSPPFKCAVFICAGGAWDSQGQGKQLQPSDLDDLIHIPAANIMGSKDEHYAQSFNLSQGCDIRTREIFDHGGGHEIPRGPKVTVEMAMAINAVIDKALLTQ